MNKQQQQQNQSRNREKQRQEKELIQDHVDNELSIHLLQNSSSQLGYLANFKTTKILDNNDLEEHSALLLYFLGQNGDWFKCYYTYPPYFYLEIDGGEEAVRETALMLEKKLEGRVKGIHIEKKVDLEQANHLQGKQREFIKIMFRTIEDLIAVRQQLRKEQYAMREFDVPYHVRVCIDNNIRYNQWYLISTENGIVQKIAQQQKETMPTVKAKVLAFDIETTKRELRFPDPKQGDVVMLISGMMEGNVFLITNREVIASDIEPFEYSPSGDREIIVYNESNEYALLKRFYQIIKKERPLVISTYNGDFFDWQFMESRGKILGIDMEAEIGVYKHDEEYYGRYFICLDCLYWVNRDSYLPQGSHGLKEVTKAKLGYNPIELDPELMVPYARNKPQILAEYSISDAVATYLLYTRHIHDFIFALGTIIPMFADEVLRKGSGTLCESVLLIALFLLKSQLLMASAYQAGIIFPNKKKEAFEKFYQGKLLDNETYIGGHVESLQSGVFRSDIKTKFKIDPQGYQNLIDSLYEVNIITKGG